MCVYCTKIPYFLIVTENVRVVSKNSITHTYKHMYVCVCEIKTTTVVPFDVWTTLWINCFSRLIQWHTPRSNAYVKLFKKKKKKSKIVFCYVDTANCKFTDKK